MKIALTGNPNSGKTSLFNAITGKIERVGNWAGVTVEKKEGKIKSSIYNGSSQIVAVDLPGAYSMSPFTSEENVTKEFILTEKPDVIINIVDATNLSRSLFFTTQLLELGIPVVLALNKSDMNKKKKIKIDIDLLSDILQCEIVETSAVTGAKESGLSNLILKAVSLEGQNQKAPFAPPIHNENDIEAVKLADEERFSFVKSIVQKIEKREIKSNKLNAQDKFDKIIENKFLGIPIFLLIMWGVLFLSQNIIGPWLQGYLVPLLEIPAEKVGEMLVNANASAILTSIVIDGIFGGLIAILEFLPLIMVLFFLLALLEDCGYMARVTVVMDGIFKKVGLSGKSIIPVIMGTSCAIPGVMASRTIKNERQRRTTAMITPFIPCGAKLPVIALIAGAFFPEASWVNISMYIIGIVLIVFSAFIVQRITGEKGAKSFFIMEMSEYKFPSIKRATIQMLDRGKAFVIKAGTVILLCNLIIHVMSTFTWSFQTVGESATDQSTSILATIASPVAFLLIPLGFGAWQLAAACVTGFVAKENVVATLATVYAMDLFNNETFSTSDATAVTEVMGISSIAAFAFLAFNMFTPPCFAAIGAMNAEMGSNKWLIGAIAYQLGVAYTISFLINQFGTLIQTGSFTVGFLPGLIAVILIISAITFMVIKGNKKATVKKLSLVK